MSEKTDRIPMTECKHRGVYKINCRNLIYGAYDSERQGFIGIREKFGSEYLFTEYHWDAGPPFGTVNPMKYLCQLPDDIELIEYETVTYTREEHAALRKEHNPDFDESELYGEYPREFVKIYEPLFRYLETLEKENRNNEDQDS